MQQPQQQVDVSGVLSWTDRRRLTAVLTGLGATLSRALPPQLSSNSPYSSTIHAIAYRQPLPSPHFEHVDKLLESTALPRLIWYEP